MGELICDGVPPLPELADRGFGLMARALGSERGLSLETLEVRVPFVELVLDRVGERLRGLGELGRHGAVRHAQPVRELLDALLERLLIVVRERLSRALMCAERRELIDAHLRGRGRARGRAPRVP